MRMMMIIIIIMVFVTVAVAAATQFKLGQRDPTVYQHTSWVCLHLSIFQTVPILCQESGSRGYVA